MSYLFYRFLAGGLGILGLFLGPVLRLCRFRHRHWVLARVWPEPLVTQPVLWLHAVSVGEIKIAMAVYNLLPPAYRQPILLTTTTPSGLAFLAKQLPPDAVGRILPWDVNWAFRRLFKTFRVPTLILVETEIWPVLFDFVKSQQSKLVIVNARLSQRTLRFQRLSVLRQAIRRIDLVAARSSTDAARFQSCGLKQEKTVVTGNIKFDFQSSQLKCDALKHWLAAEGPTVIFASMASDEAPLLANEVEALLQWQPGLRVLWVPRQVQETPRHLQALATCNPARRSALAQGGSRLLVLDSLGELSGCYCFAALSFVGGSFNARGGQNFLESLQVGTPALVGPSTENFRDEVQEALIAGAILEVDAPTAVAKTIVALLEDPSKRMMMAEAGKFFLEKHIGAVARTVDVLLDSQVLRKPNSEAL